MAYQIYLLFSYYSRHRDSLFTGLPRVSMSDTEAILQILSAPDAGGGLGAPEIRERLRRRGVSLSQPTLSRRLNELQRRGQIVRQGLRRGTLYALDPVALHFSIASERRKPVKAAVAITVLATGSAINAFSIASISSSV